MDKKQLSEREKLQVRLEEAKRQVVSLRDQLKSILEEALLR